MQGEETRKHPGFKTFYGYLQAGVDDKGRLKIPADAVEKSGDGLKVFITSFDLRQIRVYPIHVWEHNLNLFDSASENAAAAERLGRIAKAHGGDGVVDASGRVTLPPYLRKAMGFGSEAVPMMLDLHKGRLNAVTMKVFEEDLAVSKSSFGEDMAAMERIGLK